MLSPSESRLIRGTDHDLVVPTVAAQKHFERREHYGEDGGLSDTRKGLDSRRQVSAETEGQAGCSVGMNPGTGPGGGQF